MSGKWYSASLVAILCGACTTLILAARYSVDLALGFTMDGREVFLVLGAAIAGPWAALLMSLFMAVGVVIGYPGNPLAGTIVDTFSHLASLVLLSLLYQHIWYPRVQRPFRPLAWAFLVPIYYWLCLAPIGSLLYYAIHLAPSPVYMFTLPIWPEVLATTVITTLIMAALPEKWRRPLWGPALSRGAASRAGSPA
jgi:hypothetical protein